MALHIILTSLPHSKGENFFRRNSFGLGIVIAAIDQGLIKPEQATLKSPLATSSTVAQDSTVVPPPVPPNSGGMKDFCKPTSINSLFQMSWTKLCPSLSVQSQKSSISSSWGSTSLSTHLLKVLQNNLVSADIKCSGRRKSSRPLHV